MTPRRLDPDLILVRLREMDRPLDDLAGVGPVSADRLDTNRLLRHAVERILTALVNLAVAVNAHLATRLRGRTPETYRDSFASAAATGAITVDLAHELAGAAGMRDILVHGHLEVDLEVVARAVPQFRNYVAAVAGFLSAYDERL